MLGGFFNKFGELAIEKQITKQFDNLFGEDKQYERKAVKEKKEKKKKSSYFEDVKNKLFDREDEGKSKIQKKKSAQSDQENDHSNNNYDKVQRQEEEQEERKSSDSDESGKKKKEKGFQSRTRAYFEEVGKKINNYIDQNVRAVSPKPSSSLGTQHNISQILPQQPAQRDDSHQQNILGRQRIFDESSQQSNPSFLQENSVRVVDRQNSFMRNKNIISSENDFQDSLPQETVLRVVPAARSKRNRIFEAEPSVSGQAQSDGDSYNAIMNLSRLANKNAHQPLSYSDSSYVEVSEEGSFQRDTKFSLEKFYYEQQDEETLLANELRRLCSSLCGRLPGLPVIVARIEQLYQADAAVSAEIAQSAKGKHAEVEYGVNTIQQIVRANEAALASVAEARACLQRLKQNQTLRAAKIGRLARARRRIERNMRFLYRFREKHSFVLEKIIKFDWHSDSERLAELVQLMRAAKKTFLAQKGGEETLKFKALENLDHFIDKRLKELVTATRDFFARRCCIEKTSESRLRSFLRCQFELETNVRNIVPLESLLVADLKSQARATLRTALGTFLQQGFGTTNCVALAVSVHTQQNIVAAGAGNKMRSAGTHSFTEKQNGIKYLSERVALLLSIRQIAETLKHVAHNASALLSSIHDFAIQVRESENSFADSSKAYTQWLQRLALFLQLQQNREELWKYVQTKVVKILMLLFPNTKEERWSAYFSAAEDNPATGAVAEIFESLQILIELGVEFATALTTIKPTSQVQSASVTTNYLQNYVENTLCKQVVRAVHQKTIAQIHSAMLHDNWYPCENSLLLQEQMRLKQFVNDTESELARYETRRIRYDSSQAQPQSSAAYNSVVASRLRNFHQLTLFDLAQPNRIAQKSPDNPLDDCVEDPELSQSFYDRECKNSEADKHLPQGSSKQCLNASRATLVLLQSFLLYGRAISAFRCVKSAAGQLVRCLLSATEQYFYGIAEQFAQAAQLRELAAFVRKDTLQQSTPPASLHTLTLLHEKWVRYGQQASLANYLHYLSTCCQSITAQQANSLLQNHHFSLQEKTIAANSLTLVNEQLKEFRGFLLRVLVKNEYSALQYLQDFCVTFKNASEDAQARIFECHAREHVATAVQGRLAQEFAAENWTVAELELDRTRERENFVDTFTFFVQELWQKKLSKFMVPYLRGTLVRAYARALCDTLLEIFSGVHPPKFSEKGRKKLRDCLVRASNSLQKVAGNAIAADEATLFKSELERAVIYAAAAMSNFTDIFHFVLAGGKQGYTLSTLLQLLHKNDIARQAYLLRQSEYDTRITCEYWAYMKTNTQQK